MVARKRKKKKRATSNKGLSVWAEPSSTRNPRDFLASSNYYWLIGQIRKGKKENKKEKKWKEQETWSWETNCMSLKGGASSGSRDIFSKHTGHRIDFRPFVCLDFGEEKWRQNGRHTAHTDLRRKRERKKWGRHRRSGLHQSHGPEQISPHARTLFFTIFFSFSSSSRQSGW